MPILLCERAPHNNEHTTKDDFKEKENKNWSRVPDGGLTPAQTGQLTVRPKITLTDLTCTCTELVE
jgi:hypothetical protein